MWYLLLQCLHPSACSRLLSSGGLHCHHCRLLLSVRQSQAGHAIHYVDRVINQTCSRVEHTSLHPSPQSSCHLSPLLQHPCHVRFSAQKPPGDRLKVPSTSRVCSAPHLVCCCHHRCLHRRPNPHQASSNLSIAARLVSPRLHAINDPNMIAPYSTAVRMHHERTEERTMIRWS